MSAPRLFLIEPPAWRRWEPFTTTRPVSEMRFGAWLFRERLERALGTPCAGIIAPEHLAGFEEPGTPPVRSGPPSRGPSDPVLLLRSDFVPDGAALDLDLGGEVPLRLVHESVLVGAWIPAGVPLPPLPLPEEPSSFPIRDAGWRSVQGRLVEGPWALIEGGADRLRQDLSGLGPSLEGRISAAPIPADCFSAGAHPLLLGTDVEVEPGCFLDLREGPIALESGVRVRAFSRIEGPALIGPGSIVGGGSIRRVTSGPGCRLHGEMESTILLGFSNKAHDGYIGHSVLGCWVNLGAMTTGSDLKNNYSPVRIVQRGGHPVDTGLLKMGCLVGDHVKTGIGTLLTSGCSVGAGSSLFGGVMPPKRVPPFGWGAGDAPAAHRIEAFLATAEVVMARRGQQWTEGMRAVLRRAFEEAEREAGEAAGRR